MGLRDLSMPLCVFTFFFFSSRRRHTRSVSAFLLNRSSDLESEGILQSPAYHKRKPQRSDEHESGQDRKSGSAGMPRPISYAVFCLKKKKKIDGARASQHCPRLHSPLAGRYCQQRTTSLVSKDST